MLIDLLSEEDRSSFLVPCVGFECPDDAGFYVDSIGGHNTRKYKTVDTGRKLYVSPGHIAEEFDTNMLTRQPRFWRMLQSKGTPNLYGGYNVALLIEGRRQFYHSIDHTAKHPKWWYCLMDGYRDCYTVWARIDGMALSKSIAQGNGVAASVARSGRGVVYSRTRSYDDSGAEMGMRVNCLLVEFSILDRNPAKDNMLRLNVVGHQRTYSHEPGQIHEPEFKLDDVWRAMVKTARLGFEYNCQPVPSDVEEWRKFFLDQQAKEEKDRYDMMGFASDVNLQAALDAMYRVREPWQLAVVIRRHGSKFASHGGTSSEGAMEMIRLYAGNDKKRLEELNKMVRDYVEPSNNLWNYRGD